MQVGQNQLDFIKITKKLAAVRVIVMLKKGIRESYHGPM